MPLMSDWFKSVFAKEKKNDPFSEDTIMDGFRKGERLADKAWEMMMGVVEKDITDDTDYMPATLTLFVACRKLFHHCQNTVDMFDGGGTKKDRQNVRKMWELLEAVFANEDPNKAIDEMRRMKKQWGD